MMVYACTGGVFLHIHVKTSQKKFRLLEKDGALLAHLIGKPEKNKANSELVSELTNIFNRPVFLVSGHKSKSKKLKIENINAETAMRILAGIAEKK